MAFIEIHGRKIEWRKLAKLGIILIFLLAIFSSFFLFYQYRKAQELLNDPQKRVDEELNGYIKKISSFMLLSKETPTLATVTNVDKLKNQSFFANAQNGDKVLIYTLAKKAILYRPSWGKIINVGSIDIANISTPSATITPTPTFSFPTK